MPGGHLLQFDIPDAGDGVGIDDELVAVGGGCADVGLGIEFIPHFQPGGYCVFIPDTPPWLFSVFPEPPPASYPTHFC